MKESKCFYKYGNAIVCYYKEWFAAPMRTLKDVAGILEIVYGFRECDRKIGFCRIIRLLGRGFVSSF